VQPELCCSLQQCLQQLRPLSLWLRLLLLQLVSP